MTFDFLAMRTTSTAERRAEKERQKEEERAKAEAIEQVSVCVCVCVFSLFSPSYIFQFPSAVVLVPLSAHGRQIQPYAVFSKQIYMYLLFEY